MARSRDILAYMSEYCDYESVQNFKETRQHQEGGLRKPGNTITRIQEMSGTVD